MNEARTAIRRKGPSAPLRHIITDGLLSKENDSIFDYGCGYGADIFHLQHLGYNASGSDPFTECAVYKLNQPLPYNTILLTYVLNVISNPAERIKLVSELLSVNGLRKLIVTTRTKKEIDRLAEKGNWQQHNDGFITYHKTFQKGFTPQSLMKLLNDCGIPSQNDVPCGCNILHSHGIRNCEVIRNDSFLTIAAS